MFGTMGISELIIILVIVLIIFGAGKIKELANLLGALLNGSGLYKVTSGTLTVNSDVAVQNLDLVATVTGIVVALMVPGARTWESLSPANAPVLPVAAGAVMQALSFVGGLTVPLQLLVIGSQLASLVPEIHKPSVNILRVTAVRLLVAPVITVSLAWGAAQAGLVIPDVPPYSLYLIAAMNIFIGMFNLIPLLPFDGGHAAIAVYERAPSRPGRAYHADITKLMPLMDGVLLVMGLLFLGNLYLDLPVTLGGGMTMQKGLRSL